METLKTTGWGLAGLLLTLAGCTDAHHGAMLGDPDAGAVSDAGSDAGSDTGSDAGVVSDAGSGVVDGGGLNALGCPGDQVPVNGACVDRRVPDYLPEGWSEIRPGGTTSCADGSEYVFYVRPGTVNKAMLFMQGGGGCWDAITCRSPSYTRTISGPGSSGILDAENPDNPFRDWYMLFAPYCTGDVSTGSVDRNYLGVRVRHRGFDNMRAVREWIYENMTAPEDAFVTGCSAGAVGVVGHGAFLAEAYRDNPEIGMSMITDSFQGVIPSSWRGYESWDPFVNAPDWLPELLEPPFEVTRAFLIAGPRYSRATIGHFNYANDPVQAAFYGVMGGNPLDVPRLVRRSVRTLADELPNYRYYMAPGSNHCVFASDRVYTTEVNGQNLAQWLGSIARGEPVENVE